MVSETTTKRLMVSLEYSGIKVVLNNAVTQIGAIITTGKLSLFLVKMHNKTPWNLALSMNLSRAG